MKIRNQHILYLILFIAAAFRIYRLNEIPFTHDEFSALFRTYFDGFNELIDKGVKTDGHPAGVQVFIYYWIQLFGSSEWIVKLPFVFMGIGAIYFTFLIGKKWFNDSVGLLAAAFLSSIEYMVFYSQTARPYMSGMFLCLLLIYYWTLLIRTPEKKFYKNLITYILIAAACSYNHHFSLLFAFIVYTTGIFFIDNKYKIDYAIAGILVYALYIPHLPIFIIQLRVGGVGSWLGVPEYDFLLEYFKNIFQYSFISLSIVLAIIIYYGKSNVPDKHKRTKIITLVTWFLLPFIIGFYYSRMISPILQYSLLIFGFPSFVIAIFSLTPQLTSRVNLLLVLAIISVNSFALIQNRQYKNVYESFYKTLITDNALWKETYKEKVAGLIDSDQEMSGYYINQLHLKQDFTWINDTVHTERDIIEFLNKQDETIQYIFLGAQASNKATTIPIIKDYFPTIEWQKNYLGGTSYLFSKKANNNSNFTVKEDFELSPLEYWTATNQQFFIDSIAYSGSKSYRINNTWSLNFSFPIDSLNYQKYDFIDLSFKIYSDAPIRDLSLVSVVTKNDQKLDWRSAEIENQTNGKKEKGWFTIHHSFKIPFELLDIDDIKLKVYFWNKAKNDFLIDDFELSIRPENPILYGL